MKVSNFLFILIFICIISKSYSSDHDGVLNYLKETDKYSYFFKLIKKANYEKLFMKEVKFKKVLYIPDNNAFDRLPLRLQKYIWDESDNDAAKKIIKTHLYSALCSVLSTFGKSTPCSCSFSNLTPSCTKNVASLPSSTIISGIPCCVRHSQSILCWLEAIPSPQPRSTVLSIT